MNQMAPTERGYRLATSSWDEEELAAIARVTASGSFSMGAEVAAFERQFATAMGSRYCVMVNSGSSANLLMIAALRYRKEARLMPGDEVIVPAVSWSTTYFPLQQYGLHLKFVDIDLETLNFDLDALRLAVSDRTRAILAVNLLGNPNDFDAISAIVGDRDIILMEDNCESMGAEFGNRFTGTFGLAGTYSSFFSHHISTMEGGMVVTDDEELYHVMLCLRAHGWTRNLPRENHVTGTKSDDPFEESFHFALPGYNLRPLEMSGAIGRAQMEKLPYLIESRRLNAEKFKALMAEFPQFITQREIGKSSWFGFSVVIAPQSGIDRKAVIRILTEHEIETRPIVVGNFTKNKRVLGYMDYSLAGAMTNAEIIDHNGFFIGNDHRGLDREFRLLRRALDAAVRVAS
ncbi:DegT/DnrJ/EryC1/StrS family aminotransferase [Neoaquamicrobium microcysteis]|nr:DegT/DnrJ/EryC1/StrS family aminotransferase [Mesorhizobium microcysteis]